MSKKKPSEDNSEGTVVVVPPGGMPTGSVSHVRASRLAPTPGCSIRECPTNLDLDSEQGKALAVAAGNPADIVIGEDGTCRIDAVAFIVFPDERADPDSGEVSVFARVVLFDKDGRTFRTTSAFAPSRLAAILDLYGPERWKTGIPIVIRERKSRTGMGSYHDMRVEVR